MKALNQTGEVVSVRDCRIHQVCISNDPTIEPSRELIETHNRIALERTQHHTSGSCKALDAIGDDDYNEFEDL